VQVPELIIHLFDSDDLANQRTARPLGETALHFLAVEAYLEGVRFLAEAGTDVNATSRFEGTALLDAVGLGSAEMVALLLEHGGAESREAGGIGRGASQTRAGPAC